MSEIDQTLASVCGLAGLASEEKRKFSVWFEGQLNMRTVKRLESGMNTAQLDEIPALVAKSQDVVATWLDSNVPDCQNIRGEEFEKLTLEILDRSADLLESARVPESPWSWWRSLVLGGDLDPWG